ncbi:ATP-binding protein [Streptomyces sp. NPDC058861]|uniref:ATP-binding protein n=1 Tax=Streptomyces sp. NPDC058861 TaxID=3346653 RepID=UPI0036B75BD7
MSAIHEVAITALSATTAGGFLATALVARSRRTLSRRLLQQDAAHRQETADAREVKQRRQEALRHLVDVRLPNQALHLLSDHYPVPGLADAGLAGTEFAALLDTVQELFAKAVVEERRRIDAAARAALRGACMEIQAKSYQLQALLDTLQQACEDEETLKNYFRLDHLNEQVARLVQKAAIVTGSWPGQVRPDTQIPNLVTGATSRLHGYGRINVSSKLHSDTVGVVGRAAEPVAVVCTELLANALESSRADLAVEVTLLQPDNGAVCIQIDDAGKGMTAEEAVRAARLLSGRQQVLLTELGDPPALGFAAIGRLVADHGIQVTVDQVSPYLGVRAVITIPPALVTRIDPQIDPLSAMAPLPAAAPSAPRHAITDERPPEAAAPSPGGGNLPQRRRRARTEAAVEQPAVLEHRAAPVGGPPEPEEARTLWDAFERGIAAGRTDTPDDTGSKD